MDQFKLTGVMMVSVDVMTEPLLKVISNIIVEELSLPDSLWPTGSCEVIASGYVSDLSLSITIHEMKLPEH